MSDTQEGIDLATRGRRFELLEGWLPPLLLVAAGGLATASFMPMALASDFAAVLIGFYLLLAAAFALVTLPAAASGLDVLATVFRIPTFPVLRLRLAAVFVCPAAGAVIGYSGDPGLVPALWGLLAGLLVGAGAFWVLFPFQPKRMAAAYGVTGLWWLVAFSLSSLVIGGTCVAVTFIIAAGRESTYVAPVADADPTDPAATQPATQPTTRPATGQSGLPSPTAIVPEIADLRGPTSVDAVPEPVPDPVTDPDSDPDLAADTGTARGVPDAVASTEDVPGTSTDPTADGMPDTATGVAPAPVTPTLETPTTEPPPATRVAFNAAFVASAEAFAVEGTLLPPLGSSPWAVRVVETEGVYMVHRVDLRDPTAEQPSLRFVNVPAGVNGFAVGPDGLVVAAVVQGLRRELIVRRFADGGSVREFLVPADVDSEMVGLIPDGRPGRDASQPVVVLRTEDGRAARYGLYYTSDGTVFEFAASPSAGYPNVAFGPDSERAFVLFDTVGTAGMGVGYHTTFDRRNDPNRAAALGIDPAIGATFGGLAVAPESRQVAVLVRVGQLAFVLPVNVPRLDKPREVQLPPGVVPLVRPFEQGNLLWLAEPNAWLLYGTTLIDPRDARVLGELGLEGVGRPYEAGQGRLLFEPALPGGDWVVVNLKPDA
ncbi:MAG: hypothetical protein ACFCVE_02780 [Phycisphaerae bacterium]